MTCWTTSPAWATSSLSIETNQKICVLLDYASLVNRDLVPACVVEMDWSATEISGAGAHRNWMFAEELPLCFQSSKVDVSQFCWEGSNFSASVPVLPRWFLALSEVSDIVPPNQRFPHVKRFLRFDDFGTYWGGLRSLDIYQTERRCCTWYSYVW